MSGSNVPDMGGNPPTTPTQFFFTQPQPSSQLLPDQCALYAALQGTFAMFDKTQSAMNDVLHILLNRS